MPMTSPVERISGPRTVSTEGNRPKGSTASLTATWRGPPSPLPAPFAEPGAGSWPLRDHRGSDPSATSSSSVSPAITRDAALASDTPVAFATNGTVREARGLASITNTSPDFTANCTFSSPTTPSAWARRWV